MEIDLSPFANRILRGLGMRDELQLLKNEIRSDAIKKFNCQVQYGPFTGMKISESSSWGRHDLLSKLFGEYEKHVLDQIICLSKDYNHFIDIGSADGYFIIGAIMSGNFSSGTAFEISEAGRRVTRQNAIANSIGNKIEILEEAKIQTLQNILSRHGPSCILCDIEGAEFALMDDQMLRSLEGCSIIIEMHGDVGMAEEHEQEKLIERAKKYFSVKNIDRLSPDMNKFNELADWHDDKRLLAFSEGRPKRMNWLLCS